jgi:hypothetical protein
MVDAYSSYGGKRNMHPTRTKIIKIFWKTGFHNLPLEFPFFRVWTPRLQYLVKYLLGPAEKGVRDCSHRLTFLRNRCSLL